MIQLCWLTKLDRSGHLPITVCELRYGTEPFQALLTSEAACRYPAEGGLVEICCESDQQGHIIILELTEVPQVLNLDLYCCAISALGKGRLPLLTRFIRLLGLIKAPILQLFISYWGMHIKQFEAFLTMPASYQDHHAYTHGLLIHSLEVAELAYSNAVRLQHSSIECQVALVAGLFHDIGKIYSLSEAGIYGYQTGAHECLNFALLAEPLQQLAIADWDCHRMLSSMLAPYARYRSEQYAIEAIFRNADHNSCQSDRARQVFADKPAHYRFTKAGNQMVRRLPSS